MRPFAVLLLLLCAFIVLGSVLQGYHVITLEAKLPYLLATFTDNVGKPIETAAARAAIVRELPDIPPQRSTSLIRFDEPAPIVGDNEFGQQAGNVVAIPRISDASKLVEPKTQATGARPRNFLKPVRRRQVRRDPLFPYPNHAASSTSQQSKQLSQETKASASSDSEFGVESKPVVPASSNLPKPVVGESSVGIETGSCSKTIRSSFPFIGHDVFFDFCHRVYEPKRSLNISSRSIVFLHPRLIKSFGAELSRLQHPVVLVSNNNFAFGIPYTSTQSELKERPYYTKILESPKILAWYGTNVLVNHPKLKNLPLGSKWNWKSTNHHGEDQNKGKLLKVLSTWAADPQANFMLDRPNLLFTKMKMETSDDARYEPTRGHRVVALKVASKIKSSAQEQPFNETTRACKNTAPHVRALESYLFQMRQHKFVLSPPGKGLDCHRTWEALLMGAIPIVESSSLNPLYEGLPVLVVENWNVLSEQFLMKAYAVMKSKTYEWEKLFAPYYLQKISRHVVA